MLCALHSAFNWEFKLKLVSYLDFITQHRNIETTCHLTLPILDRNKNDMTHNMHTHL